MKAVRAVFRRNLGSYFHSPIGYVFITLFVLVSSVLVYVLNDDFFSRNLADLHVLNTWFPRLLLFFIPTITMAAWAEEKRQGTDELLLTLPAGDASILLGKYTAALVIYLAALGFSLAHVIVLAFLGRPDPGLMFSTYLGYLLLGSMLLAAGMVGSFLTSSMTVGFILGAVLCGGFILVPQTVQHFDELGRGLLTLPGAAYFLSITAGLLYLNLVLLHLRRGRNPLHPLLRWISLAVAIVALNVLLARTPVRVDLTAERLHSLSPQTRTILGELDPQRPVYVHAFVSPDVPPDYVQVREALLGLLDEYEALSDGSIRVKVYNAEPNSDEARLAEEEFGIEPVPLRTIKSGRETRRDVLLSAAFICGPQEVVVPFFYPGVSVEYELTRSIRTVSRPKRYRVGVLKTDARIMGGYDFQAFRRLPEWEVIRELKLQYEVVEVSPDEDYPKDLDLLVVAMPSSLTQPQMDRLKDYMLKGHPALLLDDASPLDGWSGSHLRPDLPKGANRNPFWGGPPPGKKGDIHALMKAIGVDWPSNEVVWDSYNPHPSLAEIPPEYVFVHQNSGAGEPFGPTAISSGLQEVVLPFPGHLRSAKVEGISFQPLLRSSKVSGVLDVSEVFLSSFMGTGPLNPARVHDPTAGEYVLAARLTGKVNAVVVADLDFVHNNIFNLRRRDVEDLKFDNVPFILNCVDVLVGDEAFVNLRKRRRRHRTLETLEARIREHKERELEEIRKAEAEAKKKRDEAQKRFDEKVKEIENRKDLDELTRRIMIDNVREVEQRRLDTAKANIDAEKERKIRESRRRTENAVEEIQDGVRWAVLVLPPLPAFLLGLAIFIVRLARESGAMA